MSPPGAGLKFVAADNGASFVVFCKGLWLLRIVHVKEIASAAAVCATPAALVIWAMHGSAEGISAARLHPPDSVRVQQRLFVRVCVRVVYCWCTVGGRQPVFSGSCSFMRMRRTSLLVRAQVAPCACWAV